MKPKIAIVGAGIAGLACARELFNGGHDVVLYDKSRAPGGRAATRRNDAGAWDHGAQYFVVRDETFAERVDAARRTGAVREWQPRWPEDTRETAPLCVGTPGMSALGRAFAAGLDVRCATPIVGAERDGAGWRLRDELESLYERYRAVVYAMPAPQVRAVAGAAVPWVDRLGAVTMSPCWAAMLAFEEPLEVALDADWRPDPVLPWIARDRSKPGRGRGETWLLHAATDWTIARLEADPAAVAAELADRLGPRLEAVTGAPVEVPAPLHASAHLWRYARVEQALGEDCLWDAATATGACGDWCIGARVEAAFQSGRALGLRMLETLSG